MKISVVVPFYNTPLPFFLECLRALKQLDPYEVILVDDCSTDINVVRLARSSGFRYLKTPYQSGHDGMPFNLGVRAAKGEYICRVDSDDVLRALPETMETEICFGNADRVNMSGPITVETLILGPRAIFNATVLERKLCLRYPVAEDANVYGDVLMALRLLYNGHSHTVFPKVNYIYRKREGSIQASHSEFHHRLRLVQTVARFCQLENVPPMEAVRFLELAMLNVRHGSNSLELFRLKKNTLS